jgi:hypothetical protein
MITMSVSARIYYACQLDDGSIRAHYGLKVAPPNGRKGYWFTGPESAWRELADDVDFRSDSGWSDGRTRKTDGLHGRITKAAAKVAV